MVWKFIGLMNSFGCFIDFFFSFAIICLTHAISVVHTTANAHIYFNLLRGLVPPHACQFYWIDHSKYFMKLILGRDAWQVAGPGSIPGPGVYGNSSSEHVQIYGPMLYDWFKSRWQTAHMPRRLWKRILNDHFWMDVAALNINWPVHIGHEQGTQSEQQQQGRTYKIRYKWNQIAFLTDRCQQIIRK